MTEYLITPRIPGVRPVDPPDYDGITFVYVFTYVMDPWVMPAQLQNVVLAVENAQGFLSGMPIIIEGAGAFEVVSTDVLNRMTVQNLGYFQNAAPGTGIAPGKVTTTSLPGPKGDPGPQGIPGVAATIAVGSTITSPAGQNANVTNSGSANAAVLNFTIPRGIAGPQGPQGPAGQAYSNVTTASFSAANPPVVQTLSLQSTAGLAAGVILYINPIGYYQITQVTSGTQVSVVNSGTTGNASPGTVAPNGSAVLGTGPAGPPGSQGPPGTNGSNGTNGAQGPTGATGATGTAATVAAGTTTTGAPGTSATVTNAGTSSAAVFNFTIPRGDVGAVGPQGVQGTPGSTGAAGATGAAATIAAGTTSTSAPGTNAAVTNAGTSSAAIFNFTIPRGDVGAIGPAGPTAVSADAGNQSRLGSDSLLYTPGGVNGFIAKTSAYSLTLADRNKYVICSGGSWTLTLPAPSAGLSYQVRNDMGISGTTGTITLSPTSGTIDGLSTLALLPQQDCTVITDGTNWRTMGRQRCVVVGTVDITSSTATVTCLLPVGYRDFEIFVNNYVPVTNGSYVQAVLSYDGGSTWQTTTYYEGIIWDNAASTVAYSVNTNAGFATIIPIGNVTWGSSSVIKLCPGITGTQPTWIITSQGYNSAQVRTDQYVTSGMLATGGIANAIKFNTSSGNFSKLSVTVKGFV